MEFDPSSAVLVDSPETSGSGFDPSSATLVEETPGLMTRAKDALKKSWGAGNAIKAPAGVTDATFSNGVPGAQDAPTAIKAPGSVMDGYSGRASAGLSTQAQVNSASELIGAPAAVAVPTLTEARGFREAAPDVRKSTDRANVDALARSTARRTGALPEVARNIAATSYGAAGGNMQGAQAAALGTGSVEDSGFDFTTAKEVKGAGQVERGLKKGALLLGNQALGVHKFLADTVGAEDYSQAMSAGRKENSKAVEAIGDRSGHLTRNFEGALQSIVSNAPGLIFGVATGTEAIPLAIMGAQVFGDEYSNGAEKGRGYAESTARAGLFAAAEIIGEKLAIGDSIKAFRALKGLGALSNKEVADEFAKHIIKSSLKEIPGEELTTTLQFLTDKIPNFGHNPEASLADYLQEAGDTFTTTIMQSAMMAGGGRAAIAAHKHLSGEAPAGQAPLAQPSGQPGPPAPLSDVPPGAPVATPAAAQPALAASVPAPTQSVSRATPPSAPDESMQFADLTGDEAPIAPPDDTALAPGEYQPAPAPAAPADATPVADVIQQAYGDSPVFTDLIQSGGAGLGLGSLGETLTRVAPKVAAAKAMIAAQRARTEQEAIDSALAEANAAELVSSDVAPAAAQLSPLQRDIAKIKARQAASVASQPPAQAVFPDEAVQQVAESAQPVAENAESPSAAAVQLAARPAPAAKVPPNQRRDDLVGAIMRVTGGRGIAPGMAMTLTDDPANNATKLRGLFTSQGQQDMDDLAMMLRESEGYDVADGNALSEMIREAAAGNVAKSMERQAQDKADGEEKQHRSMVRAQAKKLGIKTVAVAFSKIELEVFASMTRRHDKAVSLLDDRSRTKFEAALEMAYAELGEDVADSVMMDVQSRGLKANAFWNEVTKLLRAKISDAQQEKINATIENATEGADPYAEEVGDGPGDQQPGSGADADRRNQAPAPAFELGKQTDAEIAAKLARENDAKTADRARIKAESEAGAGSFNLEAPQKPVAMVEAENKAKTSDMFAVDQAAHESATSPRNDLPEPTDAQKKAGNYKVGKIKISGLNISIENPEGSTRSGIDPNGKPWSNVLRAHYGYLLGTIGNDKDHVDVFVKPGTAEDYAGPAFVIDQKKGNGHFDEHKVMLGWASQADAERAYKANYAKGWDGIGAISEMDSGTLKQWVESADKMVKAADWIKTKRAASDSPSQAVAADTSEMDDLAAEMGQAIGELASILGVKQNLTPEEESRIIPVMSKIFRIAAKMGFVKFKDAARYVIGQIRKMAGDEVANKISIDNLQAGYINVAREIGGDKREAMAYDSIDELEKDDVTDQRSGPDLERNSGNATPADGVGAQGVQPGRGGDGEHGGSGVQGAEGEGGSSRGGVLFGPEAVAAGERGDQSIYRGSPRVAPGTAGGRVDLGSPDSGVIRPPVEPDAAGAIESAATSRLALDASKIKQRRADKIEQAPGLENIRAALPVLTPGQQEDVHTAEARFVIPDGYGMLFTNGTGTGKTFSGLGVVKRFIARGKDNILVVAPNDKIIEDWQVAGKLLGVNLTRLASTDDAGAGPVITTYANMGANDALAAREWDLVVHDEAHYLAMDKDGTNTNALKTLRAITKHPDGAFTRAEMLNRDLVAEISAASQDAKLARMSDDQRDWPMGDVHQKRADAASDKYRAAQQAVKQDVAESQGEKRPRALFLSATPFAYEKTVDWANGYIFDYNTGRASEEGEFRGYNQGSNRDQFFIQNFGYRMRTGKLTEPDAKVDRGVMQRQFNTMLKKTGALSGRMLDVKADYDRRFILVDSAIGQRIDEALQWFEAKRKAQQDGTGDVADRISAIMAKADPYVSALNAVRDTISEKFDYLSRRYLLESIKAREVVPHIREHLAMGRKVVVFHDYKKGGGFNPFILGERAAVEKESEEANFSAADWNKVVHEFNAEFRDIINSDLFKQSSPIDMFLAEFPGVLLFNGDVPAKNRRANVAKFQDDASGPQVMLVQSQSGKEGISLHDTTGKHQRVLFNLGQPTQPTTAIQQEGRIYRTGQVTDAMFRYLNTGTNWEKWAFATTIATRSSTAENLGMGEQARALKDAFISGFEESGDYRAGMDGEGKGGKERDRAANNALTEYDRARAFYFGTQQKNSRTKAQEGADYFATPEPVGLKMVELADIRPGEDALEPSAGHGAIARWLPDTAEKTAIEPSMSLRPRLAMVFDGKILGQDFESLNVVNKYDAIVMNPPFGSAGRTAIDHLAKAATHLRDGGRIVALIPAGPSADKKFEKWMYGEETRSIKPLFDHPELGNIFRGDVVTTRASWMPEGKVTRKDKDGNLWLKADGQNSESMVNPAGFTGVKSKGPRSETYSPSKGFNLVADIALPSVTFERAGTQVMTRIVVIEKSDNAPQQTTRDYSGETDVKALFDRMESLEIKPRSKAVEVAADAPAAPERNGKPVVDKVAAQAAAQAAGLEIVEHTTGKGKVIRGVVRMDLTKDQAKAIDEFTFAKNGGFFIREKHLVAKDAAKFSRNDQTKTPEFKKWFGDWQDPKAFSSRYPKDKTPVSQAVGDEGAPLTLYHATNADFSTFEPGRPTVNSTTFGDVETERHAIFASPDRAFSEEYLKKGSGQNVMPVFMDIKSPMDMREGPDGETIRDIVENSEGAISNNDFYHLPVTETWSLFDGDFGKKFVAAARAAGYDGAIIRENTGDRERDSDVYVAFDPAQVKSAIGNNGQFSPTNPDIRYSRTTAPDTIIAAADLAAVVTTFRKGFSGVPVVTVERESQLPDALQNEINEADAGGEVAGAFHRGSVYLVRDNLRGIEHAEDTVMHEAEHAGLRNLFGASLDPVMLDVWKSNLKVQLAAKKIKEKYSYSQVRAIEEVLAEMGPGAKSLKGWPALVSWVRAKLRKMGFVKEWTDQDVEALVLRALASLKTNGATSLYSGSALSRNEPAKFSRIIGDSGRQYTADQQSMFSTTGREVDPDTTLERIKKWAGKNWVQGVFDQFEPIKHIDRQAYVLTRLSRGASGAFEAFMKHGKLSLKNGAYDADTSGGVLREVFYPIGKETTDFLYWIAGNRAERLAAEGKERLFSVADIAAAKSLAAGQTDFDYLLPSGQVTRDRPTIYKDSLRKFNEFNKNVMDMAEQSGLIDGLSRHMWEHEFYVPFYRTMGEKDGEFRGMSIKQGVVRQTAFKKLKGGKEGLNDLLANTLMNWAHLIDASAKNRAAKATIEASLPMGIVHKAKLGEKNTVWHMDGGKKLEFGVDDPELLTALNGLDFSGLKGLAIDLLAKPKNWLTVGVTASPFFKVRNLIRDSVQSVAVSGLSLNVAGNLVNGYKLTKNDRPEYVSALAGGALIRFGTMLEGNEAGRTRQLIKKGAKDEHILDSESKIRRFYDKFLEPGVAAYNELGNRGEEINRMSLYDQLIKQGMSHAEASFQARDLMDFSAKGSFTTVRFLTQIVPFMNARLQGMYKLGVAAKQDKAKFAIVTSAIAAVSVALAYAYGDDDDWNKREEFDRDNYWWFKIGDTAYRIPKPFELGAIGTLAERSFELMANKEMTGERFAKSAFKLVMDQLAMNPIPQMVKPILDIYSNRDSFTGRDIESMSMERVDPEYRFNSNTSMPARGLSKSIGGALSPVQIDHLVRGYFAWLGATSVATADLIVRYATDDKDRPTMDYWKLATGGIVADKDSAGSRYVSAMYDQAKEIESAYATFNLIKEREGNQAAREYKAEHAGDLARYDAVKGVKKDVSAMSKEVRNIERSDLAGDVKRYKINQLRKKQSDQARKLFPAN